MKILIVEDERRASHGLRSLIEKYSQNQVVGEAQDGKEALEIIKSTHPDVIITDIRMPVMDGITLIKTVRALGFRMKFVILSAYEEFEFARQAIDLGVISYLVKPVVADDVKQLMSRLESENEPLWQENSEKSLDSEYPNAHPLIKKCLKIIEESYASGLSQKDIAESLELTPEYFSYLFAKNIGENFSKFLRKYRIEKAKELLRDGKIAKDEVCYSAGFTDAKYFAKCFKASAGESVSEYWKRYQKQ